MPIHIRKFPQNFFLLLQALLQLNKPFPAIQAAEKALMYNPTWWIGYQTLGRSQLGMGDLEMVFLFI